MNPGTRIGKAAVLADVVAPGEYRVAEFWAEQTCLFGECIPGVPLVCTRGHLKDIRCTLAADSRIVASGPLYMVVQAIALGHLRFIVERGARLSLTVHTEASEPSPFEIVLSPIVAWP